MIKPIDMVDTRKDLINVADAAILRDCAQSTIRKYLDLGRIDGVILTKKNGKSGTKFFIINNDKLRNCKIIDNRGGPKPKIKKKFIDMCNGVKYRNDIIGQNCQHCEAQ